MRALDVRLLYTFIGQKEVTECLGWSYFNLIELLYQLYPFNKMVLQQFSSKSAFGSAVREKMRGKGMWNFHLAVCVQMQEASIAVLRQQDWWVCRDMGLYSFWLLLHSATAFSVWC